MMIAVETLSVKKGAKGLLQLLLKLRWVRQGEESHRGELSRLCACRDPLRSAEAMLYGAPSQTDSMCSRLRGDDDFSRLLRVRLSSS